MAIELQETFQIASPIDRVWQFIMSAENLAACLPGASLTELLNERKFNGTIKLKIGAITAKYQGTITYTEVDEAARRLVMLAEAKEKGGGTINGTITTTLLALPNGQTEVRCESRADLTGKIVQVGRGMIEGVAQQIINKFVKNVKNSLEIEDAAAAEALAASSETASATAGEGIAAEGQPTAPATPPPPPKAHVVEDDSINVLAVVFQALWEMIKKFFRRLLGKK